jgi:hypothetical protein
MHEEDNDRNDSIVELDPELRAHVHKDDLFGLILKHSLAIIPCYSARQNEMINRMVQAKRERLSRYERDRDWSGWVFTHERPWRTDALIEVCKRFDVETSEYWALVSHVHVDSENLAEDDNTSRWRDIWQGEPCTGKRFGSASENRTSLMTDSERSRFSELPEKLVIYRGSIEDPRREEIPDLCWSLSEKVARWFANRFQKQGEDRYLVTGEVDRSRVLAFFDRRSEEEVVVLPESVDISSVKKVTASNRRRMG